MCIPTEMPIITARVQCFLFKTNHKSEIFIILWFWMILFAANHPAEF